MPCIDFAMIFLPTKTQIVWRCAAAFVDPRSIQKWLHHAQCQGTLVLCKACQPASTRLRPVSELNSTAGLGQVYMERPSCGGWSKFGSTCKDQPDTTGPCLCYISESDSLAAATYLRSMHYYTHLTQALRS